MKYIDYMQLNPFQKIWYNLKNFFTLFPKKFANFFIIIGTGLGRFFKGIGKGVANFFYRLIKGGWATKLSYLIMGVGNMVHGQIIKGLLFLGIEVGYICYMVFFAWDKYLSNLITLGTSATKEIQVAPGIFKTVDNHNSMLILLYSVLSIVITVIFLVIYVVNTKSAYNVEQIKKSGKKPDSFMFELKQMADTKYHTTLLSFPVLTIGIFTILPLIFMILIAFTNFDGAHTPPGSLFTWVGLENFKDLLDFTGASGEMGKTFFELTKWTIVWAVCATFSNYILGMIIALMINKKGIKLKALWRTLFVVTVAVPQFVSLLVMAQILDSSASGPMNLVLGFFGLGPIKFLTDKIWVARLTVIIVNCWVGIPYTILITSGILMNIPADLYESATIDGAGPVKSFTKITLPYMLFVTTPYLITNFISNINNFNVIYLLSGGGPSDPMNISSTAGRTDLLVTWLFKLTMGADNDYKTAATIGILVFIVCATLSLITFNMTKSAKNEEEFS